MLFGDWIHLQHIWRGVEPKYACASSQRRKVQMDERIPDILSLNLTFLHVRLGSAILLAPRLEAQTPCGPETNQLLRIIYVSSNYFIKGRTSVFSINPSIRL